MGFQSAVLLSDFSFLKLPGWSEIRVLLPVTWLNAWTFRYLNGNYVCDKVNTRTGIDREYRFANIVFFFLVNKSGKWYQSRTERRLFLFFWLACCSILVFCLVAPVSLRSVSGRCNTDFSNVTFPATFQWTAFQDLLVDASPVFVDWSQQLHTPNQNKKISYTAVNIYISFSTVY